MSYPLRRISIGSGRVLTATPVFDTYWQFAAKRQEVFFRRVKGGKPPWTNDPIIAGYRFTNAYRAADRVSQYLIRHVIYEGLAAGRGSLLPRPLVQAVQSHRDVGSAS